MKSTLVGLGAVTGGAWVLFAIGRLLYQANPGALHAPSEHYIKPGWHWWDFVTIAPLLAIGLGIAWLVLWSIGEKIRGRDSNR